MITSIADIIKHELYTIDMYDGVCKAETIMESKHINCLAVLKDGKPVGILTSRNIRMTHPNRIVADAMSKHLISVTPDTYLWEAKQVFDENMTEGLLVIDKGILIGMLTKEALYAELGKSVDLLTGLYRSDYIYYTGMELLKDGAEVCVLFIDLDQFGEIDKKYGHTYGDIILKEVGMLLQSFIHDGKYLCRFGGDEFIILTRYSLDKCLAFAETVLKETSTHNFTNNIKVSISIGIAGGRRNEARNYALLETIASLVNLASLASTKAKSEKTGIALADDFLMPESVYRHG